MPSRRSFLESLGLSAILGRRSPQPPIDVPILTIPPMPEGHDLLWGTYGKDLEHWPWVRVKRLDQCADDHLRAILETDSRNLSGNRYIPAMALLLEWRAKHNQPVEKNEECLAEFHHTDAATWYKWFPSHYHVDQYGPHGFCATRW